MNNQRGNLIGISATSGAAILGLSGYKTSFEVWQRYIEKLHPGINAKMGYKMPEPPTGSALLWGKAFETPICKLAEEKIGEEIISREAMAYKGLFYPVNNPESDDAKVLCYLDGIYARIENGVDVSRLHNGKTTNHFYYRDNFGEPGTDRVPMPYMVQAQHEMICTGAKETIMSVLVFPKRVEEWEAEGTNVILNPAGGWFLKRGLEGDQKIISLNDWARVLSEMGYFHQYVIHPLPELQDLILSKYRAWWNNHIFRMEPPEPESMDDLERVYHAPVGSIILTDQEASLYREYKDTGSEMGIAKKNRELLKIRLLKAAAAHDKTIDDNSRDKWLFYDQAGNKLGQFDGKTFR